MEQLQSIFLAIFDFSSVWSVVARAVVWFAIAGVIIVSTDATKTSQIHGSIKRNLGLFLLILVVSSALLYMLFSFTSAPLS